MLPLRGVVGGRSGSPVLAGDGDEGQGLSLPRPPVLLRSTVPTSTEDDLQKLSVLTWVQVGSLSLCPGGLCACAGPLPPPLPQSSPGLLAVHVAWHRWGSRELHLPAGDGGSEAKGHKVAQPERGRGVP